MLLKYPCATGCPGASSVFFVLQVAPVLYFVVQQIGTLKSLVNIAQIAFLAAFSVLVFPVIVFFVVIAVLMALLRLLIC